MSTTEEFMQIAISLARAGMERNEGGPFGAIVVKDGQIVGRGNNRVTSTNDPTSHAEIVAIRDACQHLGTFQLSGCEIYTSCEPCPMCLGAIYWARPDKVYFAGTRHDAAEAGFDDEFIYSELSTDINTRTIRMEQILRANARELFRAWLEKEDRLNY